MPNHVMYDALWESDRLADCSRDAAMAYPWIFLVADDHGRFEYKPRAIWKNAFAYRQDISVEDVAGWLDEYWRVGLLIRYHLEGDLAHWYKFKGRKPSERRKSEYPDPEGVPVLSYTAPEPRDDPEERRDDPATTPRKPRVRDRSDLDHEIELDQSGLDLAPPSSARVVPTPFATLSWSNEAASDWIERHGGKPPGAMFKALGGLVPPKGSHSWSMVRPVLRHYLATRELDFLSWPKFESGFLSLDAETRGGGTRGSPAARAREEVLKRSISGGLLDERKLGQGDGVIAHGGLEGPDVEPTGSGVAGGHVPKASRPPDGR